VAYLVGGASQVIGIHVLAHCCYDVSFPLVRHPTFRGCFLLESRLPTLLVLQATYARVSKGPLDDENLHDAVVPHARAVTSRYSADDAVFEAHSHSHAHSHAPGQGSIPMPMR